MLGLLTTLVAEDELGRCPVRFRVSPLLEMPGRVVARPTRRSSLQKEASVERSASLRTKRIVSAPEHVERTGPRLGTTARRARAGRPLSSRRCDSAARALALAVARSCACQDLKRTWRVCHVLNPRATTVIHGYCRRPHPIRGIPTCRTFSASLKIVVSPVRFRVSPFRFLPAEGRLLNHLARPPEAEHQGSLRGRYQFGTWHVAGQPTVEARCHVACGMARGRRGAGRLYWNVVVKVLRHLADEIA
jgi:hypothetical protein